MMERTLLIALAHGLATVLVLKILSFLLPSCIISYYTDIGNLLLCLYVAKVTLPLSKKRFLSERVQPENKAVLITGCDSGFGHHLAKRLDAKGYHVIASCLFPSGDGAETLRNSCSKRLQVIGLDVTSDESVKDTLKFVKESLGTSELWAIVNNAGVFNSISTELSTIENFQKTFDVNTIGMVRVTKAFLPLLRQSKGRVVNLTSLAGRLSFPHLTAYTMSKAAARVFTECLKQEMDCWGVKAITIEPELFKTAMTSCSAVSNIIDNSWKNLDDHTKADYGEKYVKSFKSEAGLMSSLGTSKIHLVVDALESAVSLEQPDAVYKPCRGIFLRFLVFLFESSPQIVSDLTSKIFLYVTRFPFPKEAENKL